MAMRIGIIGCGLIGQKRAKHVGSHHVVAVADVDNARADLLAHSVGGARVYANWQDLIGTNDVDAVIIATPHDQLALISLAAIESGKHVLLEKPGARHAADLAPVVAAAERHRVAVKVGYNHRFHPALIKAKEIVDSGAIGPLMFIRGRYGHGGRIGYDKEWRCKPEISGGGELVDQGSHLIDLSRWFLGDFTQVQGTCATYFWDAPVDDNCFLTLSTSSGQIAWLHASWTEWKNLFSFEIYGKTGKLHIDGLGGSYGTERLGYYRMSPQLGPPETTIWEFPFPDRSWELEFQEFTRAIDEGRQPLGNIHDAKAVLDVIDQIYQHNTPRLGAQST